MRMAIKLFISSYLAAVLLPATSGAAAEVEEKAYWIHYKNPLLVLGCVPVWENKILLCRRAIEPRRGFWTVPAGFMENGETMGDNPAWAPRRAFDDEAPVHPLSSRRRIFPVTVLGSSGMIST